MYEEGRFQGVCRKPDLPVYFRDRIKRGGSRVLHPEDHIAIYGQGASFGHVIVVLVIPGPAPAQGPLTPISIREVSIFFFLLEKIDDRLFQEVSVQQGRIPGRYAKETLICLPITH